MSADRYSKLQERYESMTDRLLGSGNANGVTAPPKPKKRPKSTAEIRSRATEIVDDHDRRLRLINDHMWQHRQEGRELKRLEMDYTRTQRNLKTAMQAKERDVEKRKAIEERRLLEKQMTLQRYEQHDLHQAFDSTRTKTKGLVEATTRNNEAIKKQIKATNKNEYAFEKLCEAVDRKRVEVQKLSEEFELKIRRKEEEQFLLQKKLAEVAITLNMEAHKKRKEEADSISHRAKEMMKELREKRNRDDTLGEERRKAELAGRQYEERKKELAKSLRQEKERMELKGRETGRKLGDVRRMLVKNTEMQTFAVTASEHVEGTRMLSDMEEKMRRVEEKRKAAIEAKTIEAMQKNGKGFDEWSRRMSKQQNDIARKEHEDRIRSLVKDVQRQDDIERRLYDKARSSEEARRKQDQVVCKLQEQLEARKRENAKKLRELAISTQKVEEELKQKILRESAELSKTLSEKQESLRMLAQVRFRSQEERYLLEEEKREHDRILRIEERTDFAA